MNFFRSVRDNLRDPKKRALTQLGLYLLFFIFVFAVLSSGNSSIPNYVLDTKKNVDDTSVISYEYVYEINDNNNSLIINGTYKNNEEVFNYNNVNYYRKDDKLYINNSELTPVENINFNIDKFKYNSIDNLIKNSDFINETEYNDGNKKSNYFIVASKYFELINEESNCELFDCSASINVIVESSNYLNNILVDLSNYYKYSYNVKITYSNINNIQNLKISTE